MIKETLNAPLRERNSFGVEAVASRLIEFTDNSELIHTLSTSGDCQIGILGGGNNILFTKDYEGTLLRSLNESFEITDETPETVSIKAGAGLDWNEFVTECVRRGLWGAENLSGIPGTVGAAPVQNIGAYGAEVKDIIKSVETVCLSTYKESTIAGEHCGFGYRDSIFKRAMKGKTMITAVNFMLWKTPHPNLGYGALEQEVEKLGGVTLDNIRTGVINIRDSKLPDPAAIGNAGSFFKNPMVAAGKVEELKTAYPDMPVYPGSDNSNAKIPAGWLIEQAGWKGAEKGNAGVYPKQALILINLGGATGRDIVELATEITDDVERKFGIRIETEVNIW